MTTVADEFGAMADAGVNEFERMAVAVTRIWKIVHRPSKEHPQGHHAYTHFMADFDEIRALCGLFIGNRSEQ